MRRHERPDGYLDSFISCAQRMREFMYDDEDFEEDFDEELCEEPEHEFGGMTMTM
jgi:hypothetical protein